MSLTAGHNYYGFLPPLFRSQRATCFRLLQSLTIEATTQDEGLVRALRWLKNQAGARGSTLTVPDDFSWAWIPDRWWRWVTGQTRRDSPPATVQRPAFECCAFSELAWALKAGDCYVVGSDLYADYRTQLISEDDYRTHVATYGVEVGLAVEPAALVDQLRNRLMEQAATTDAGFPRNSWLRIEDGRPILTRLPATDAPDDLKSLEAALADQMPATALLDVLADTEYWLHWTQFFGPVSGHAAKVDEPVARYLATVFCYGCNLGPSQTARALDTLDRRQVAWIHAHHITEEQLDAAIQHVINAYNRFALPRYWGAGRHAAADGTKWDLYEQNLLSEYHIRYGGYGGIGYYHVSDTYIALFSHFIPCGVWEAVYILDGLLKNESDIQPDIVHADTQGQNAPVFGLAYLLGIQLMPRIRNWQDLVFARPTAGVQYGHIDSLFGAPVDWDLIARHVPDMLRVALSIKEGRIAASTVLRKLSSYSRKSKLYQAFRELGRAVRTDFLLRYLHEADLRATIQAATNKSEAFNGFAKWLFFGGEGTIASNDRAEQRKIIKYNHLVANCLIFFNVFRMTQGLHTLQQGGQTLDPEALAALSPYGTAHVNRFGRYELDLTRQPPSVEYALLADLPTDHS